jgi:hypothetical protein
MGVGLNEKLPPWIANGKAGKILLANVNVNESPVHSGCFGVGERLRAGSRTRDSASGGGLEMNFDVLGA